MSRPSPFRQDELDPTQPTGLIYGGMGGPDSPHSVGPFLRNLFRDPAVLPLPAPMARFVGSWIVRRRLDEVRERYALISPTGGSPQLGWARQQCSQLEFLMSDLDLQVNAAPAMRYWHPFPIEAVQELMTMGVNQFLVVPAYPHYASATTGSIFQAIEDTLAELAPRYRRHFISDWHLLPGYLDTLAGMVEPTISAWHEAGYAPRNCCLLFAAHSLPKRFVRKGDPYLDQTRATVAAVNMLLTVRLANLGHWWLNMPGASNPLLAFQSKVGPVRWLEPDLVQQTHQLAAAGCRHLLVLPISFTCEHIETLYELDIELAAIAQQAGIETYQRGPALNLDSGWLTSLAEHLALTAFPGFWTDTAGSAEDSDGE